MVDVISGTSISAHQVTSQAATWAEDPSDQVFLGSAVNSFTGTTFLAHAKFFPEYVAYYSATSLPCAQSCQVLVASQTNCITPPYVLSRMPSMLRPCIRAVPWTTVWSGMCAERFRKVVCIVPDMYVLRLQMCHLQQRWLMLRLLIWVLLPLCIQHLRNSVSLRSWLRCRSCIGHMH